MNLKTAALLLLACALPARSEEVKLPPCVHALGKKFVEPPTFQKLQDCQRKAGTNFLAFFEKKFGPPSEAVINDLYDFQEKERQGYLERNGNAKTKRGKGKKGFLDRFFSKDKKKKAASEADPGMFWYNMNLASRGGRDQALKKGVTLFETFLKKTELADDVHPDMLDLIQRLKKEGTKMTPETKEKFDEWLQVISGKGLSPGTRKMLEELDKAERGIQ